MGEVRPLSAAAVEGPETHDDQGTEAGPHGRDRLLLPALVVAIALVLALGTTAALVLRDRKTQSPSLSQVRAPGIPTNVPTSLANLMGILPLQPTRAPGFVLTDQNRQRLALSSLRGKVVVLEFMDPHCVDICPLVSEEFVDAYHDLGPAAGKVVFVAVNVNEYHLGVRDVLAYSEEHGLVTIPGWHFVTGPLSALQAVWHDYAVLVQAPSPRADVVHTSIVYVVDPRGVERYAAAPSADRTAAGKAYLPADQLAAWGRGIALLAEDVAS